MRRRTRILGTERNAWQTLATALAAAALLVLPVASCDSGNGASEAMEEMGDEADDAADAIGDKSEEAADEVEDEVDDHT